MSQPSYNVPTEPGPPAKAAVMGRFKLGDDLRIERHEAKYIVPYALMPEIRRYIEPLVVKEQTWHRRNSEVSRAYDSAG